MAHEEGLPGIGESQEIGQEATRCLHVHAPRNWVTPKDLGGTDDYGLDFQIQLKVESQAAGIFRLQLKGTRSPTRIEAGKFISIPLSATTLRYYRNIAEPILLVVCDLSVDPDPRKCPLHYVWVRQELRRIDVDHLDLEQEKANLRVPTANVLTYELDLLGDVRNANELAEAGHALDLRVADLRPALQPEQRVALVHNLAEAFNQRSATFLDAVASPASEHWPKPEAGTLAADLIDAARLLRTGKVSSASAALARAESKLPGAVELERGEYYFLRGRQAVQSGDDAAACAAFLSAARTTGQSKHWAGWAEGEQRRRFATTDQEPSVLDFADALAMMPEPTDAVLATARARLLAASNQADEARRVLARFTGAESMAGLALVETMASDWGATLAACDAGLQDPQCTDSTRLLFQILRARARHHKALAPATSAVEGDIVPPSGPPGVDTNLLRRAWEDILTAVDSMEDIGWSSNAEFVVDILVACASMLGKQKEALIILRSAVFKQPASQPLNGALETIAAQCGQFDLALQANSKLEASDTQILRRIAFLFEIRRRRADCVALTERELPQLSRKHQLFGAVLVLAARAAHDLARSDLVTSWARLLESDENLRPHAAILDYHLSVSKNPLSAPQALATLAKFHADHDRPLPTTIALFEEIDPGDEDQATLLLELAQELRTRARLAPGMAVQIGLALITLKEWETLLRLCDDAEHEFDGNPRLVAFKGLALDRLGNTADAREVLGHMLDGGIADGVALRTYVNIAVRCGFSADAIVAAEQMLGAARTPTQRRECLRLLFNLVQTNDPHDPRLVDLAVRMGDSSDPTSEVEEGVYLAMMFLATSTSNGALSPDQRIEIDLRAKSFFEEFPDSKVLKRIQVGESKDGELLRRLKAISGVTQAQQDAQARMQREMRNGELPIPFAWLLTPTEN